jgi:feruloyl esterase
VERTLPGDRERGQCRNGRLHLDEQRAERRLRRLGPRHRPRRRDDPASCTFDLSRLACTAGPGPDCLTEGEQAALDRRFTDLVDEKGKLVYPGFVHGLETDIGSSWFGTSAAERGVGGRSSAFPIGFFRDYVHGDPAWKITDFDLRRDLAGARQGLIGFSVAAEDPDLSRFAARGGKLLQYHGWHDMGISARRCGTASGTGASRRATPASRAPERGSLVLQRGLSICELYWNRI